MKKKGLMIGLIIGIFLLSFIVAVDVTKPVIQFISPTPNDGGTSGSSLIINTTITDASETSAWLDWDKTLVGYWTMGDYYNSTGIFDNSSYDNFGSFKEAEDHSPNYTGSVDWVSGIYMDDPSLPNSGYSNYSVRFTSGSQNGNCFKIKIHTTPSPDGNDPYFEMFSDIEGAGVSSGDSYSVYLTNSDCNVTFGTSNITAGKRGSALEFDGNDDYVQVKDSNSLDLIRNLSIFMWVKPALNSLDYAWPVDFNNGDEIVLLRKGIPASNRYSFFIKGGRLSFTPYVGVSWNNITGQTAILKENSWQHIGVIYDDSSENVTFYINGEENESFSKNYDFSPNTYNLNIGGPKIGGWPKTEYFNGLIDELMIFNRSLSEDEVKSLYEGSSNRLYTSVSGLSAGVTYNYSVYAIDTAGNLNITTDREVTTDTSAPNVNITTPSSGQSFSSSRVSFEVHTNENSNCNYSVDSGATNYSLTANATGTGHTGSKSLSNANYVLNVYCGDGYGNTNNSESVSFSVSVIEEAEVTIEQDSSDAQDILAEQQLIPVDVDLGVGKTTSFEVGGGSYDVTMQEIDYDNKEVITSVQDTAKVEEPQVIRIKEGESRYFDFDGDGNMDMSITISSISKLNVKLRLLDLTKANDELYFNYNIYPKNELVERIEINDSSLAKIVIKNMGTLEDVYTLKIDGIEGILASGEAAFSLLPRERATIKFNLSALGIQAGDYNGKITITPTGANEVNEINLQVKVKKKVIPVTQIIIFILAFILLFVFIVILISVVGGLLKGQQKSEIKRNILKNFGIKKKSEDFSELE